MHSKTKWMGVLLILILSFVVFAGTALAQEGVSPDAILADVDGDGLHSGIDPDDTNADSDGDGLCDGPNLGNQTFGVGYVGGCEYGEDLNANGSLDLIVGETDPNTPDTDGDGLCDGPDADDLNADGFFTFPDPTPGCRDYTRGDPVWDGQKINRGGEDKDRDGVLDAGHPAPYPETDPTTNDTDGDGLPDGWIDGWDVAPYGYLHIPISADGQKQEWEGEDLDLDGELDGTESDPRKVNSEGDFFDDLYESVYTCMDPTEFTDKYEDEDGDLVPNWQEYMGEWIDLNANTIKDPQPTDKWLDYNLDGLVNVMNPCDTDTDDDGMWDGWEMAFSPFLVLHSNFRTGPAGGGNIYANGFCPVHDKDANGDYQRSGVLNPMVNDAADDFDGDAASNYQEFLGVDGVAPPDSVDRDQNWGNVAPYDTPIWMHGDDTSPCNPNSDGEDVNLNDTREFWEPAFTGAAGAPDPPDRFIDGYEYWNKSYPAYIDTDGDGVQDPDEPTINACGPNQMHPRVFNGPAPDLDGDTLSNLTEYKGEDGLEPLPILPELAPGDVANPPAIEWDGDDPWYRFQTVGDGADATQACVEDTDLGGVPDNLEYGSDPNTWDRNGWNMLPNWRLDDQLADHDFDGLPSFIEDADLDGACHLGPGPAGETCWLNPDTDWDGLCDGDLNYVVDDPDGVYAASGFVFPGIYGDPSPPTINFSPAGPPPQGYENPIILSIQMYNDGYKMFDLDSGKAQFGLPDDYICGGGEDLDRDGAIAGDVDGDFRWDIAEDLDGDGVLDANEDDGPGPGQEVPFDDGDNNLDGVDKDLDGIKESPEEWTETDPRNPDTDGDWLCDGSNLNAFGPANCVPDHNQPPRPDARDLGEDLDDDVDTAERGVSETNPLDSDTDDDGLYDFVEVDWMGRREECRVAASGSDDDTNANRALIGVNVDVDGDELYDGFFDVDAVGLDVGFGTPLGGEFPTANFIGFIPWDGFDGPNDDLDDDGDGDVVNDPDDDDQPGEDVDSAFFHGYPRHADQGGGFWRAGGGDWNTGSRQETNACDPDSDRDTIWDATEYNGYEAPFYSSPWNTGAQLRNDTDIDRDPVTAVLNPDGDRPALDPDSDGDLLCDGDITSALATGCNRDGVVDDCGNDGLCPGDAGYLEPDDNELDFLEDNTGLITLIGEDVSEPYGVMNDQETWPMWWDSDRGSDGDRVDDGTEVRFYETFDCGTRTYRLDLAAWDCDGDGNRNALDQDSDADGLPDGWIDGWDRDLAAQDMTSPSYDGERQAWEGEDFDSTAVVAPLGQGNYPYPLAVITTGNAFNGRIRGDELPPFAPPPAPPPSFYETGGFDRIWTTNPADDNGIAGGIYPDPENWLETDPLNMDSDNDGIDDGDEANSPLGCYVPWNGDTDNDGMADGWFDVNGDGQVQLWEGEAVLRDGSFDPLNTDAIISGDNGMMEDPVSGVMMPIPAHAQDGIIDWHETWLETNPCNPDSDEDGIPDYVEVWGWEAGHLISNGGWIEASPVGHLDDGPRPTPDPDNDGKFNAVDPNADGFIPNPQAINLPTGDYTYAGDGICDSNLSGNGSAKFWYNGKTRNYQRVWPGPFVAPFINETDQFQSFREVCHLDEWTVAGGPQPINPITNTPEFGEDLVRDGLIGYGGFYMGNPVWNAFEGESKWAPPWPLQNLMVPLDSPNDWDIYLAQGIHLAVGPFAISGYNRAAPGITCPGVPYYCAGANLTGNWDYPDGIVPFGATQDFLAVGDWDRDRVIDDNADGAYDVPGFDDMWNWANVPATLYTLVEDWGETDPLNWDTDQDGIADMRERTARYSGENHPRAGFCQTSTRWGPVTRDQDFDRALDGEEDVDLDGVWKSGLPLWDDRPVIGDSTGPSIASPNSTGVETDPCDVDTDGDGLMDGEELHDSGTDPADTDTDDDGLTDLDEVTGDKNVNWGKEPTDPNNPDTDNDGLNDGDEVAGCSDPNNEDTDGDGINDGDEVANGSDPCDPNDPEPQQPDACHIYDFNDDNRIDIIDVGMVASRWEDPDLYAARFDVAPAGNPDGVINIADVASVAVRVVTECPVP
ncbi:MAG: hypothetical protein GY759_10250 [Chloroflexi bacterium]|nr:hypothetical protein [Chloroflexota bacterium]